MDQYISSFILFSSPKDSGMDRIYFIFEDGLFQESLFDESSIKFVNQLSIGHAPGIFFITSNSFDRRLLLLLQDEMALVFILNFTERYISLMRLVPEWQQRFQPQKILHGKVVDFFLCGWLLYGQVMVTLTSIT